MVSNPREALEAKNLSDASSGLLFSKLVQMLHKLRSQRSSKGLVGRVPLAQLVAASRGTSGTKAEVEWVADLCQSISEEG